jgi:hypothetical protein
MYEYVEMHDRYSSYLVSGKHLHLIILHRLTSGSRCNRMNNFTNNTNQTTDM